MAQLENYESSHAGGFRRIYPEENEERYAKFFDQGTSLCSETTASRARSELSKKLREEIEAKKKEIDSYNKILSGEKPAPSSTSGKCNEVRPESPARSEKKRKMTHTRRGGQFHVAMSSQSSQHGGKGYSTKNIQHCINSAIVESTDIHDEEVVSLNSLICDKWITALIF